MTRSNFIFALAMSFIIIALVAIKLSTKRAVITCQDCNVILISLEILRTDHLPCYGYSKNTAPSICEFAEKSILFENHYTQEPYSLPAHASLFTSLYPSQHKLRFILKDELPEEIVTLAQILKAQDYTTFWSAPLDDPWVPINKGLEKGFMYFEEEIRSDPIVAWEKTLHKAKNYPKFFAFLHTFKIHEPYIPSNPNLINLFTDDVVDGIPKTNEEMNFKYRQGLLDNFEELVKLIDQDTQEQYKELFSAPQDNQGEILQLISKLESEKKLSPELQLKLQSISRLTWQENLTDNPRSVEFIKALYDTQIYETDMAIKRLLEILQREQLLENTIIIIYSPLGESFNEHGIGFSHSADLYQNSINTPLIMYIPKFKPMRVDQAVQSIDIMPTTLDLLGIKIPDQAEGFSLLPILKGLRVFNPNHLIISELRGGTRAESIILDKKWKLIINYLQERPPRELYNLQTDPKETQNLIDNYPEIEILLEKVLDSHRKQRKNYFSPESEFPGWLDEETRQRLIREGYF